MKHVAGHQTILAETRGRVRVLTLHRPERLNAVNETLYGELASAVRDADSDAAIGAIVVTGSGRAFCAGADLKAHAASERTPEERRRYIASGQEANLALQSAGVPAVAAVHGPAVGAGLELALSCDFIVVAPDARLRLPEIPLGTFVGGGVTYTLPARVGMARARELIYLGDFFSGADALEWGLADRSAPAERVVEEAVALAGRLADMPGDSLAHAKRLLTENARKSAQEAMAAEARALEACMGTESWREGVEAFSRRPQTADE